MLSLDDERFNGSLSENKNNIYDNSIYKDLYIDKGLFNHSGSTYPIIYNANIKRYMPVHNVSKAGNAFLGWLIKYNDMTHFVDVLYRGFLYNTPLKIPNILQEQYIQCYIYDSFQTACKEIIKNMPNIKKLKRINLKMITKQHALFIRENLDKLIQHYEIVYNYEKSQILKAQITTTPFYINDNGIIKLYNFQTNELTMPDLETEGYFLAYFTFFNDIKK